MFFLYASNSQQLNFIEKKRGENMGARLDLLKFRKAQGLTQKEMAEKLNLTQTHYSRIETGDSNPSIKVMERLKEVFNVEDAFKLFEKC